MTIEPRVHELRDSITDAWRMLGPMIGTQDVRKTTLYSLNNDKESDEDDDYFFNSLSASKCNQDGLESPIYGSFHESVRDWDPM